MRARFIGSASQMVVLVEAETPEEKLLLAVFCRDALDRSRHPVGVHIGSQGDNSFSVSVGELPPGRLTSDGYRHDDGCARDDFHPKHGCEGTERDP